MRIDLKTVGSIAAEVARAESDRLEVVGVSPSSVDGSYTEIMIVVKGCRWEPCAISLGILRDRTTDELRSLIAEKLRTHLASAH